MDKPNHNPRNVTQESLLIEDTYRKNLSERIILMTYIQDYYNEITKEIEIMKLKDVSTQNQITK